MIKLTRFSEIQNIKKPIKIKDIQEDVMTVDKLNKLGGDFEIDFKLKVIKKRVTI